MKPQITVFNNKNKILHEIEEMRRIPKKKKLIFAGDPYYEELLFKFRFEFFFSKTNCAMPVSQRKVQTKVYFLKKKPSN